MPETPEANTQTPPAGGDPKPAATTPQTPPSGEGQPPAGTGQEKPAGGDVLDTGAEDAAQSSTAGDVLEASDDAQPEGVPDQYTFDAPEGLDPETVDATKLDAFKEVAKEQGLTQTQFQKLVEYDLERSQAAVQEAVDGWNARVQGWREAARTDKDFGGDNYDANVKTALKAVEQFGDAELKALLKSPSEENPEGLAIGNHPAILRFLHRIGTKLGDPSLVVGEGDTKEVGDDARLRRMYPSMFKESA